MGTTITDYTNVHERANHLGCTIPQCIAILPTNFVSAATRADFLHLSEAATVRSLFRGHDLSMDELLPAPERAAYIQNNSFEWVAPTLFVSSCLMTENPAAVNVALNVLSAYIVELFKGSPNTDRKVKIDIVVEKKGDWSCKKIHYDGDPSGLNELPPIIRGLSDE